MTARSGRAAILFVALVSAVAASSARPSAPANTPIPWYLSSPAQFRLAPPPPPQSATTRREIVELVGLEKRRTAAQARAARYWNGQPAVVPWTSLELRMIARYRPRPAAAARALALLETCLDDARIAAHDSRDAYRSRSRPVPARLSSRIHPLLRNDDQSSYAPPEAAMAGAAEIVLAYLFPNEPASTFHNASRQAVESRLWAGLAYRSDGERAAELGRSVASLAISRAMADGFGNSGFSEPRPSGEEYWQPTPPQFEPPIGGAVGTWVPLLMKTPSDFRSLIPGPSPYGSPSFMGQLARVLAVRSKLTADQRQIAYYWDDGPGTATPPGHWFSIAMQLTRTYRLENDRATELFALLGAVERDSAIAFFDAKYHWWSIRPITAAWRLCDGDSRLCTEAELAADPSRAPRRGKWYSLITTPPFPSYPAGHSTFSGAAGRLLSAAFPTAGSTIDKLAGEAAMSRLYGGIHFPEDNRDGLVLGRAVASLAIARGKASGRFD